MKKWIGDHQVDSTKVDPTYSYTMAGLTVNNPSDKANITLTPSVGHTYQLYSDTAGGFDIFDLTADATRFSISSTGVIDISNAAIGNITTLDVLGDATVGGDFRAGGDASVSGNLFVGEAIGVDFNNPQSSMCINGGLEIGSNTGISGGLLVSDAPSGTEVFQVTLGNGGLTHVIAADTGGMSLEAGEASIEIGNFGIGTINLNGSTEIFNTPGIPSLQVDGDTTVSGNLYVGSDSSFLGTATFNNEVDINYSTSSLAITNGAGEIVFTANPALRIEGETATLTIGDNVYVDGLLWADSDTTVSNNLFVGGDASIIGNIQMAGVSFDYINANGALYLQSGSDIGLIANGGSGVVSTLGALEVGGGHLYVSAPFWALHDATISGDATVYGEIVANGNIVSDSNIIANNGLYVYNGASINTGDFHVNNGEVTTSGVVHVGTDLTVRDTTLSGRLLVYGDSSLINPIYLGTPIGGSTINALGDLYLNTPGNLYLVPTNYTTVSGGGLAVIGETGGIAINCTTGNVVTKYDMSCAGALRTSGIYVSGQVGDTTNAVINGRTFQFVSGILISIT
jgi:hypothetical protein